MADLPDSRLGYQQPPFTNTGVDYFGPMLVRHGRNTEKRLFTCLTTRAVHLEIAYSLDTDSSLMAVRRMMARFDDGTNFVSAEKELLEDIKRLNSERMVAAVRRRSPMALQTPVFAHFGAALERLVQSA